jgi:hypothetical protein
MSRSKHYGDVYNWIVSNINSCVTVEQTFTCNRLVRLFSKSLPDDEIWYDMIPKLDWLVSKKRSELLHERIEKDREV